MIGFRVAVEDSKVTVFCLPEKKKKEDKKNKKGDRRPRNNDKG
jgi:hypothetical protein